MQKGFLGLVGIVCLALLSFSRAPTAMPSEEATFWCHLPVMFASAPPLERQVLAFTSDRDANDEIYVMRGDGSGQTNLTNNLGSDTEPAWSPDGTQIAFASDRDGNPEVYVMLADGTGQTNLTNSLGSDTEPVWSPDGTQIAFTSDRDGNPEIYVVQADGTGQTNLTNNLGSDTGPVWSPDGSQIAFTSERDVNQEIYVMHADGTGQTNLTNNPGLDGEPSWSPDGTHIAFISYREAPDKSELYVMAADGQSVLRLTNVGGLFRYVEAPSWSPDGAELLFVYGYWDPYHFSPPGTIAVILADGTEGQPRNVGEGAHPTWSRDGRYIAFSPKTDPSRDILAQVKVMNADGSEMVTLTDAGENWRPIWAPLHTSLP